VVDNFSTGNRENLKTYLDHPRFEIMEGDISQYEVAAAAVRDNEVVLHQAAIPSVPRSIKDPLRSHAANTTGTLNMLIAAQKEGVKKFVYASSSSIYGDNPALPKKEDFPVNPISPYALNKYTGERYAQLFWKLYGLPTVCLRYFNVFGPQQDPLSQYAAVVPKFITAALEGASPLVHGDGTQSRDFTYIENVVQANLLAAHAEEGSGEVFNVACGQQTSLKTLLQWIGALLKREIVPEYGAAREGDVPHSRADITKAAQILHYQPTVTPEEGLRKTVAWYQERFKISL